MKHWISLAVLLVTIVDVTLGSPDSAFCQLTPKTDPSKPLPTAPAKFYSQVEARIGGSSSIFGITEYYDRVLSKSALEIIGNNTQQLVVLDRKIKQSFVVDLNSDHSNADACKVQNLTDEQVRYFFLGGGRGVGGVRLYGPAALLLLTQNEMGKIYTGNTTVRGIQADQWYSCYWDNVQDITMEVNVFYSTGKWTNPDGSNTPVPLRVTVRGKYTEGNRTFSNSYDIYQYREILDETSESLSLFHVPDGYVCEGRISGKKFPAVPRIFTYDAEITTDVDGPGERFGADTTSMIKEGYDFERQITRMDYRPDYPYDQDKIYGNGSLTKIRDFKSGVEYIRNNDLGNCSYGPIRETDYDSATKREQEHLLRLKTPEEFFYSDNSKYYYNGKTSVRGINADSFITRRIDLTNNMSSIYSWHFLKSTPVKLEIITSFDSVVDFNIFNFKAQRPDIDQFSVVDCFRDHLIRHFVMTFGTQPDHTKKLLLNLEGFRYAFALTLQNVTKVSPFRIDKIELSSNANSQLAAEFSIAERATLPTGMTNSEPSLDSVVTDLKSAVQKSNFIVNFVDKWDNKIFHRVNADPNGFDEIGSRSFDIRESGYSPGSMAGIGLVMLIIGFVIGIVMVFFVYKFRGRNLPEPF